MSDRSVRRATRETEELVGTLNKGLGALNKPASASDIAQLGWQLLREDLSLPSAVLYQEKVLHNRDWMQAFIKAYGLLLAPHGKTTMAPKLFHLQIQGGAWGITLATVQQTSVAHAFGIRRILMANQLIGKQNMSVISRLLEDPGFDFFCLVDSATQVDRLGSFFAERGQRLQVLIELGVRGGRAGVRDWSQLQAVLASLDQWRQSLILCGIEIYEGVLQTEVSIRNFLRETVSIVKELAVAKRFDRDPILLSGAGSAWYDVVAEEFAGVRLGFPAEIVLRPGCYLTHDVGVYRTAQQRVSANNPIAQRMQSTLQPALQLWTYVQSIPEAGHAIVALGKRDAAFDSGLPTPSLHFRPGTRTPIPIPPTWQLTKMMDQHAYLSFDLDSALMVGDMIGFDISHPCLTFDKWRYLPVLDSSYTVIDVVETFF